MEIRIGHIIGLIIGLALWFIFWPPQWRKKKVPDYSKGWKGYDKKPWGK